MSTSLIIPKNNIYFSNAGSIYSFGANIIPFGASNLVNNVVPDLKQHDIQDKEEYYCGPVSAANGIIMLSQKGFSNLFQSGTELNLIEDLASYFKTDKNGTTSDNMCKGLESFVNAKGYKNKIAYQGFRLVDTKYKTAALPDFNWIKSEINKGNAVFLNIGVYKKNVKDGKTIYTRQYGHFVTATGNGYNGLAVDPNYLTIHDPYNKIKENHYIKINQIKEGRFIHNPDDNEISLTNNATGFYEISPKFNYFNSDEVGVINGVISLGIEK